MGKKLKHEEYLKRVKRRFGNEIVVIGQYVNSSTKIRVKHTCGYEFDVFPTNLLFRSSVCPECSGLNQKKQEKHIRQEWNEKYGLHKIEDIWETRPGIYFIFDKNKKLLYIGKATNIRGRLIQHYQSPCFYDIDKYRNLYYYADYIVINGPEEERDEAETRLINILMPPLNKEKTYTYKPYFGELLLDAQEKIK